jgi:hypothetical protein
MKIRCQKSEFAKIVEHATGGREMIQELRRGNQKIRKVSMRRGEKTISENGRKSKAVSRE